MDKRIEQLQSELQDISFDIEFMGKGSGLDVYFESAARSVDAAVIILDLIMEKLLLADTKQEEE